jgi:hypothetical protein
VSSTPITIQGGLPLDVASTLMRLIGLAYPGAQLVSAPGGAMRIEIPDADRGIDPGLLERAAELKVAADEYTKDALVRMSEDGSVTVGVPAFFGSMLVPMVEALFDANPDAENYLETQMHSQTVPGRTWVVIAARSPAQTPHALRLAAQARAETAEAEAARLRAELTAA